jgi:hypothetical protein
MSYLAREVRIMDPNAALDGIRAIVARVLAEQVSTDDAPWELDRLAEYAGALDEWLSHGGFRPAAWH